MQADIVLQDQTLYVSGVLNHQTGGLLCDKGKKLIQEISDEVIDLDCSKVEHSSSVGIALLLALLRFAKSVNKKLKIDNLPLCMRQIAEVSNVLTILQGN